MLKYTLVTLTLTFLSVRAEVFTALVDMEKLLNTEEHLTQFLNDYGGNQTEKIALVTNDCFELGRQAYNNGDHYHTVLWMQESLERFENESAKTVDETDILEYLAYSTFMQGNVRHALKLTNDLLQIAPYHPRAAGNRVFYEDAITKDEEKKRGDDGLSAIDRGYVEKSDLENENSERYFYERLCRGEHTTSFAQRSQLFCRYINNRHPFFFLQPLKEEEMSKVPRIVVYHDLMSDLEIKRIQQLASPRLRRATVQNYKSGELEVANYRISKSSWLRADEDPVVAQVNERIQFLTGLEMETAEELQVVNYGIGGHYEPHFDFARMSDVDAGGATVFPHIGVTLWPRKGSAAFWFNLYKNGEGDLLTRHAACPVLAGSKWVSNKWIHERGQEFRRPCGLKIND
uniref:procollagen-proline 4-dioxygenase n=1 Tax=Strigamia maritima TaxID=126957 RepID=T1IP32_STRMM